MAKVYVLMSSWDPQEGGNIEGIYDASSYSTEQMDALAKEAERATLHGWYETHEVKRINGWIKSLYTAR